MESILLVIVTDSIFRPVVQICNNKFDSLLKLKAESQRGDIDDAAKKHLIGEIRALAEELQSLLIDQAKVLTQAELLLIARLRQNALLLIAQTRNDGLRVDDWNIILPNKEKIIALSVPIKVNHEDVMTSSPSPKNSLSRMHSSTVLREKEVARVKSGFTRVNSVVLNSNTNNTPPSSPTDDNGQKFINNV